MNVKKNFHFTGIVGNYLFLPLLPAAVQKMSVRPIAGLTLKDQPVHPG